MNHRTGEKIGWSAGWFGGFAWVLILSIVFLFQGKSIQGWMGLTVTGMAVIAVIFFAPWRFPSTPYWRLMLAPYVVFMLSIAWAVWAYGGLEAAGLTAWDLLWLLPLLLPFGSVSKRKWDDSRDRGSAQG